MVSGQTPDGPPIVLVGVSIVMAGGAGSGGAYRSARRASDPLKGSVYTWQCSVGAGGESLPPQAQYGWRIAGHVVSLTADEAVIELEWQRILTDGQPATSPGGSIRHTLRNGERLTLDAVNDLASCGQVQPASKTFEVRFGPSGSSGGAGGGGRGGSGGSVGTTNVMASFDVDLWLVHGARNREDTVTHQTLRIAAAPIPFQFAPVRIVLPQGDLTVRILGSIGINTSAQANQQFMFAADRHITFVPNNRPARDPTPDARGGTRVTDALPGPDEVVSFEMPPVRVPDGGPAIPDRFSVRVRITPVKAR